MNESSCLSITTLAEYFADAFSDERCFEIETHLATCATCMALSSRIADQTRASLEADLYPLAFLADAVAPEVAGWAERLRRWMVQGSDLTVSLADAGSLVASGFERLLSPSTPFTMESALLSGQRRSTTAVPARVLQIPGLSGMSARIVFDPHQRRLSLQLDNVPRGQRLPLVAIHGLPSGPTVVQATRLIEGLSPDPALMDLIADFDLSTLSEQFLVVLEPGE